MKDPFDVGVN